MKFEEALGIAEKIAENLSQMPEIRSVALYGSMSNGIFDEYSDIDLVCFCTKIPNQTKRITNISNIKELKKPKKNWENLDLFKFKGLEITIKYLKINYLRQNVGDIIEKGEFIQDLKSEEVAIHVLDSMILVDKNKTLETYKKELYPLTKKLKINAKQELEWVKSLWDIENKRNVLNLALKRKNVILANQIINITLEYLVKIVYQINQEYYLSSRWIYQDLKNLKIKPKNFMKNLEKIYELPGDIKGIKKKIAIMTKILRDFSRFKEFKE